MTRPTADVVVVGAGPGGLTAAIGVARRGFSVHVLDKKRVVGVPVKCGEYFPVKEEMARLLPGVSDMLELFDVPNESVSNKCTSIGVISPKGRRWEFDFEAFILDRTTLEQHLASEAERLGAVVELGKRAQLFLSDGQVAVGSSPNDAVRARVVIAADGFPSAIAQAAGLPVGAYSTATNVAINYQYSMENVIVEQDVTEMYLGIEFAPGGYGWIIPKGNRAANVGVGVRTPFMRGRDGRECLEYFTSGFALTREKLRGAEKSAMIADVLPVDGPLERTFTDTVLAVGDAAGMVMPTNGGGIATAMITGRIAGEVAAEHLMKGSPLSLYEERWKRCIGREMLASARMRRFADIFMKNDDAFHLVLKILGAEGIKNVVTCRAPKGLAPLLPLFG